MRRATITTTHGDAAAAERVARAVAPDNTAEMETDVDGETVVTKVERETTGGLQSSVDDYVVNCTVAAQLADQTATTGTDDDERTANADTTQS